MSDRIVGNGGNEDLRRSQNYSPYQQYVAEQAYRGGPLDPPVGPSVEYDSGRCHPGLRMQQHQAMGQDDPRQQYYHQHEQQQQQPRPLRGGGHQYLQQYHHQDVVVDRYGQRMAVAPEDSPGARGAPLHPMYARGAAEAEGLAKQRASSAHKYQGHYGASTQSGGRQAGMEAAVAARPIAPTTGELRSGHLEVDSLYGPGNARTLTVNSMNAPNNSTMQCGCENIDCPFCNQMMSIQMGPSGSAPRP